jgi:beta-lactamase class C
MIALALRLTAAGALQLDAPLAKYLPAAGAAQPGVTLRRLLCHTSGLPLDVEPWLAPYAAGLDWPTLAQACQATPLARAPQTQVVYSNLGAGLLAIVVEQVTCQPFPDALTRLVFSPLRIEGYLGVEPPRAPAVIAGRLGTHSGTPLEPFNSAFYRSLALPWAGLVTTAAGALALVRAFAGEPAGFLPRDLAADATRDQTGGIGGLMFEPLRWPRNPWGLGVELRGDKTPHWTPPAAAPSSFGHTGASGCIAWHDPVRRVSWAILGARTMEGWWRQWAALGAAILLHTASADG